MAHSRDSLPAAAGKNLVLTGFMGTGKTAVGQNLARRLGRRFIDTDMLVEELTGLTVARVFELHGEPYFRQRESEAVEMLGSHPPGTLVVATGGGAVLSESNRSSLRRHGLVILLTASVQAIIRRTHSGAERPLLAGGRRQSETVAALLKVREPHYRDCDLAVDTTGKTPARTAAEIIELLNKSSWNQS